MWIIEFQGEILGGSIKCMHWHKDSLW